jgi:hypothetical protein
MPESGFRSGADIQQELQQGQTVSWKFNSSEKRLHFTLPKELGGRAYDVCLSGGYTFRGQPASAAAVTG